MTQENIKSPLQTATRFVDLLLLLPAVFLIARFALILPHPAKWDALWPFVQLRAGTEPLIAWMAALGKVPPASPMQKYLPLVAALAVLFLRFVIRSLVYAARARSARIRAARWQASGPGRNPEDSTLLQPAHAGAGDPGISRLKTRGAAGGEEATLPGLSPAAGSPHEPAGRDDLATQALPPGSRAVLASPGRSGSASPVVVPQLIGRYEVISELGHGAMGVVYKAQDPHIGRLVAIKAILGAGASDEEASEFKQRFRREAQAAGQLTHPGIVGVYDILEAQGGEQAIVMEFVEGQTLEQAMAGERLPIGRVAEIVIQVAEALDFAHAHGVVHRDIKPANILIAKDGRAKISDFGIAKLADSKMTRTGTILGTPAFMSPEQFSGAAVDLRSDLFSLGSILYWMCTGERPFPGETITAIAYQVMHVSPVAAHKLNPALPAEIDAIIGRCLAKNPSERYLRAADLAKDLAAFKPESRSPA